MSRRTGITRVLGATLVAACGKDATSSSVPNLPERRRAVQLLDEQHRRGARRLFEQRHDPHDHAAGGLLLGQLWRGHADLLQLGRRQPIRAGRNRDSLERYALRLVGGQR